MRRATLGRALASLAVALGLFWPEAAGASVRRDVSFDANTFAQWPALPKPAESVRAKYDWGADHLNRPTRTDEWTRYMTFDGLGSVTGLTSASGDVTATYHLDAWGNYRFTSELETSHNRFGFTGHYWDKEASLYYAKARYYDPFTARFTQADSFLGTIDDPPSLHRYQYANDNPTSYTDEDGHSATAVGAAAGFMWGFGQMIGAGADSLWGSGKYRSTGDLVSIWTQNTIGGAEIGASIDIGMFSGGLAASASGALGNAGFGALTLGGESAAWGEFGRSQVTDGAVGAALGPVLAKALPLVGKGLSLAGEGLLRIPGAKTAWARVAEKGSQLAGSVVERFTVAESDAWITRPIGEQLSTVASAGRDLFHSAVDPLIKPGYQSGSVSIDLLTGGLASKLEAPPLTPGRTALRELDIDLYGTFRNRPKDGLTGHELLQNAWLELRGYGKRGSGFASTHNPAVALFEETFHGSISKAQQAAGLWKPSFLKSMTAEQNIAMNAQIMRDAGVPEHAIQILEREALQHAALLKALWGR